MNGRAIKSLDKITRGRSVDHCTGQYVVGAIHTNTIEGFWSLIKRGIIGNYHKVSPKVSSALCRRIVFQVQ